MKNILWGVLVLALVVVAILLFKGSKDDLTNENALNATSTVQVAGTNSDTVVTKPATFKSLLAQTGNFECKYEQVSSGSRSTNVIYLSGGKMRAEFRTTTNGISLANLMVYDGVNLYVWKEGQSTGTKSQPKTIAELPDVIPADITSAAVYGTSPLNVSYDCHPWSTKASLLVKPSYVTFK